MDASHHGAALAAAWQSLARLTDTYPDPMALGALPFERLRKGDTGHSPPTKAKAHELGGGVGLGGEVESEHRNCARGAPCVQQRRGIVVISKALAARGFFLQRTPAGIFIGAMGAA